MQLDPNQLVQYGTLLISIGGGYLVLRAKVKTLEDAATETRKEMREARDSIVRAQGASEAVNNRFQQIESTLREIKDARSQDAVAMRNEVHRGISEMKEIVREFAGVTKEKFDELQRTSKEKLDGKKASRDDLQAITGQHEVFDPRKPPQPRPRHTPIDRREPDTR